jgi:hypothetical protein
MNADQFGMSYSDFQKRAGALHVGRLKGIFQYKLFGMTYGSSPYWGENYYQFRSSLFGYKSVMKKR